MRSGAAAKLRVEKIRMQRMSVERLGKRSKVERERRMNTPWHRINSEGPHKHSIMLSIYLIKSCCAGLYDEEPIVGFF